MHRERSARRELRTLHRRHHPGHQQRQKQKVPPVQRQILDLRLVNHFTEFRRFRLQRVGHGLHLDRALYAGNRQVKIRAQLRFHLQPHVFLRHLGKARRHGANRVHRRRQPRHQVCPGCIRRGMAHQPVARVRNGNFRIGNRRAARVKNVSQQRTGIHLGKGRSPNKQQTKEHEERYTQPADARPTPARRNYIFSSEDRHPRAFHTRVRLRLDDSFVGVSAVLRRSCLGGHSVAHRYNFTGQARCDTLTP